MLNQQAHHYSNYESNVKIVLQLKLAKNIIIAETLGFAF